jgi:hypothetical protein
VPFLEHYLCAPKMVRGNMEIGWTWRCICDRDMTGYYRVR